MSIRIGREYVSKVEGEIALPVQCGKCAFASVAVVKARGEGRGTSALWLRNEGAASDAESRAHEKLKKNARQLADLAACPSCGSQDRAALHLVRVWAWVKALALAALVAALVQSGAHGHELPLPLLLGGALVVAFFIASEDSWKWKELDQRVRVLDAKALAEFQATTTARADAGF